MAKQYTIAGSRQGVQVLSQTQVRPVQQVNIYTKPHATYVQVEVPLTVWRGGNADKYLAPVAANIEIVWKDGFINGAQFVQDVDSSGLLASYVDFVVFFQLEAGLAIPYSTIVRVPVAALSSELAFTTSNTGTPYGQQIAEAYNQLAAMASG